MTDKPWFRFKIKDDVVRGMTKEQYKESQHYIRLCAKTIRDSMVINEDAITDLMVYGASPVIMAFPDVEVIKPKEFYREFKFKVGDLVDYPSQKKTIVERVVEWFSMRRVSNYKYDQTVDAYVCTKAGEIKYD